MVYYPDVMVDIETTGTRPETTHIIQIAAVRFNLAEATVDPNVFNRSLAYGPNRFWDESTRDWWGRMPDVLDRIMARMEPPRQVLEAFRDWVGRDQPTFWAKPTTFDYTFLQSYFHEFEVANPFNFRNVMDMNSFIRARHFPEAPPRYEKLIEFEGDEHDAIFDVFHQIKTLFAAYEATK